MTLRPPAGAAPPRVLMVVWERFLERPVPWLVAAGLVLQALALGAMLRFDPTLVAMLAIVAALSPVMFASIPRTLALFIVVLMAIPRTTTWPFMPITYSDEFAAPFIGVACLLLVRDRLDRGRFDWYPRSLTPLWVAFAAWMAFAVARGLVRSVPPYTLMYEVVQMSLYGTFFLALEGLRKPSDFRLLFGALLAGISLVFLEYVGAAALQSSGELQWGRVISRQANLTVAVAPVLVGLYLTGGRRARLWLAGLVPLAIIVLLSQQRALFVGFVVAILVTVAVGWIAPRVRRRRIIGVLGAVALAGAVAWTAVGTFAASRGGPAVSTGIAERTGEAMNAGGAPALVIRFLSFAHVWNEKITEHPIIGWGLGDMTQIPVLRGSSYWVRRVDNSYIVLWWKTGLVGLVLFLTLWGAVIIRAWRLARHPHRDAQVVGMAVAGALSAALVLALASSMLTHYRFNAIWGILMGAVIAADRVYPRAEPAAED